MHQVDHRLPMLDTSGLTFHIATLTSVIPDGPRGIFLNDDLLKRNPVIRKYERDNVTFWFVALNPADGVPEKAPLHSILTLVKQALPGGTGRGMAVPIEIYAEWKIDISETRELLENAIDVQVDTPQVKDIAHKLLQEGYECTVELVNILRRKFLQYWLLQPNPNSDLGWSHVLYYSEQRRNWFSLIAAEDFSIKSNFNASSIGLRQPPMILKAIEEQDIEELNNAQPEVPFSFAEDMIATALIELAQARIRSAILHSIIALESTARKALNQLLTTRLTGLEQGAVLDAISKEVSVVTLARVVYSHVVTDTATNPINWVKIGNLYDLRNTIVHRSQRRLPKIESIKEQVLEIFYYVHNVESYLR